MVELDTALLKVASRCNIDCHYCYVYHMGDLGWSRVAKVMTAETWKAAARALGTLASKQHHRFAVVLHGGEPLLLGAGNLRKLLVDLREALPAEYPISIQSNGLLIDDAILDVCAGLQVDLSVSLDGPREVHDRNRVAFNGAGTFDQVMKGIAKLKSHSEARILFSGVLAVIDPTSDPSKIYRFFKSIGVPSVDFICRDGNHSQLPFGKRSVVSTEYGVWMRQLLDEYLSDKTPLRIRILDDLIKLVLGGKCTKEGVGVTDFGILVIDTDGSITKNDTLKSSFDGADRFATGWSVHTDGLREVLDSDEFADYHALQRPSSAICRQCPELSVCGGGMVLHRWRDGSGYDNPSVYCEDQKLLIAYIRNRIATLAPAELAPAV